VFGLDGSLDPIVSSVVDAIKLGNGGIIEQDGWKFTVSKDGKFLQRSRYSPTKVVNVKYPEDEEIPNSKKENCASQNF
jgi:hypothetical protein